jgi:hypothetical protein
MEYHCYVPGIWEDPKIIVMRIIEKIADDLVSFDHGIFS